MHEFEIIKKYFSKLSLDNKSALNLNDDVFFDKSKKLVISVDTYINKSHFFDLSKKTSSFNLSEFLLFKESFEKYFLIMSNSCIRGSELFCSII